MYLYILLAIAAYAVLVNILKRLNLDMFIRWINWTRYSPKLLSDVEKQILSSMQTPYTGKYVDIGPIIGRKNDKVWTVVMNETSKEVPIVLMHGMGSGIALWVMNLAALAKDRPLYAMDILGFGRSSRPIFSTQPKALDLQMVAFIEEWRRVLKLEKFILLGHSLGAYIGCSYAMQYPSRIEHLILADPWGLSETPVDVGKYYKFNMTKRITSAILSNWTPLWGLRFVGPLGSFVVALARSDLANFFKPVVENAHKLVPLYLHQCNARRPSGEYAFHTFMHKFAFAKIPQIHRMHRLSENVPLTIIYGGKSWVDRRAGPKIKANRPNSYVNVEIIKGSGHYPNYELPGEFTSLVLAACQHKKEYSEIS